MSSVPADDAGPGRGSEAWVADRCAALIPLASALTDTTATAAALLGESLARSKRRGGLPGSETERVRAQVAVVYLGRSTAWAVPQPEARAGVTDSTAAEDGDSAQVGESTAVRKSTELGATTDVGGSASTPAVVGETHCTPIEGHERTDTQTGPTDTAAESTGTQADPAEPTAGTLASLTRLQRVVWALREVEELTQAEIASILDRSPAVVARALAEAYTTLGSDADVTHLRRRTIAPPELVAVRSAYRRAQRRRSRWTSRVRGLVVLGVLVLAAVVAIPTLVLPRLPVYVREAGEWTFMHTMTSPQGWEIRSRFLTPSSEGTSLRRTYGGAITCTAAIVLDPALSTDVDPTTQVRINGRPGAYDATAVNGATLIWAVDEGVQARVICQAQTMQDLGESGRQSIVLIAESVRFHRTPVTMPYALTRLPDRYAVEALTADSNDSTSLTLSAEDPKPSDVNLVVSDQNGANTDPLVKPRPVRVGDRDAVLSRDPNQPTLCFAPREVSTPTTVCVAAYWPALRDGISPVPDAVIALITETAASLTLASDPTDRSTWVDARTAIPR